MLLTDQARARIPGARGKLLRPPVRFRVGSASARRPT
jgi:hypothetical protein